MKPIFSRILPKGSVLVFSLIILSVMLVTALSLLSSAVLDQRASLSTSDSTRSFQITDSGVEQTLYQVYRKNPGTIGEIAGGISGASCDDGIVAHDFGWAVRFYDVDGNRIEDCSGDRNDIASIKSEGFASGTVRAVEVAVAAAGGFIVSCPSGMVMVGDPGKFMTFCISEDEQGSERFFDAVDACLDIDSEYGQAHLCSPSEWYAACKEAPSGLNDMADGHDEFLFDILGFRETTAHGSAGTCNDFYEESTSADRSYRCCIGSGM